VHARLIVTISSKDAISISSYVKIEIPPFLGWYFCFLKYLQKVHKMLHNKSFESGRDLATRLCKKARAISVKRFSIDGVLQ
jgi:hypothetical protein